MLQGVADHAVCNLYKT